MQIDSVCSGVKGVNTTLVASAMIFYKNIGIEPNLVKGLEDLKPGIEE